MTSTQTFRRTITVLPLHLVGFFFCDDISLVIIHVIEREFRPGWDGLGCEEGEIVHVDIGVVVRDCVDRAVGITRVVNEASRAAKVHAVTHVLGTSFFLGPFIQPHQVYFLVQGARLTPAVGFFVGYDFATIGVDKLASL